MEGRLMCGRETDVWMGILMCGRETDVWKGD